MQDMHKVRRKTAVRCVVGASHGFMDSWIHGFMAVNTSAAAMGPILFAVVMDRLTDEVMQDSSWTMKFTNDPEICSESQRERSSSIFVRI